MYEVLQTNRTELPQDSFGTEGFLTSLHTLLARRNAPTSGALVEPRLQDDVHESEPDLEEASFDLLERLACAMEAREGISQGHDRRVGWIAARLAETLGLDGYQVSLVSRGAVLHDIGKIAIPQSILRKTGSLNEAEFNIMKLHTVIGAQLLSGGGSDLARTAQQIAAAHHERWDGKGYPYGLRREHIPLAARIVAVADVFDALTHERSYRPAWTVEAALAQLEVMSGDALDPQVVNAFFDLWRMASPLVMAMV